MSEMVFTSYREVHQDQDSSGQFRDINCLGLNPALGLSPGLPLLSPIFFDAEGGEKIRYTSVRIMDLGHSWIPPLVIPDFATRGGVIFADMG